MLPHPAPFFDAWVSAASGPVGFWTTEVPSAHFRTASTLGPELAQAVTTLLRGRPGLHRVLELGAGEGKLLTALCGERPDLDLVGVDLRERPADLDPVVGWRVDRWDVRAGRWASGVVPALLADGVPTLVLALEWLDDLPCPLAGRAAGGWQELDADLAPTGQLSRADHTWLRRWWPDGQRAEVGTTRDAAWTSVVDGLAIAGGAALLVDYGHTADDRPSAGTVAAFRDGRRVDPRPCADRNLTAHVAVDAVAAAGVAAGGRTVLAGRQAQVLPALLLPTAPGPDPLADLAARSRRHTLTTPTGWGAHHWLLQEVPASRPSPRAVAT